MQAWCSVRGVTYLSGSPDSFEPEICRRSAMTRTAMQSPDHHLWRLRIATSIKLRLYNAYVLPIMLYGSECWMVKKADVQWIDALNQWCLRRILDICWHDFVRNDAVRRMTQQPPLFSTVKSRQISLFWTLLEWTLDDANWILFAQPPDNWRGPPRRPRSTWIWNVCNDLCSFGMELPEEREAAQNRPFWRMLTKHSAMHPQWCMLTWIGSCEIRRWMLSTILSSLIDLISCVTATKTALTFECNSRFLSN